MKFGAIPVAEAFGATAVHSIRQGDLVLKKGTKIGPAEVAALTAAGVKEITVARLDPGDVSEDQAAADIAAAIRDEGVRADRAFTGRCNLFADSAGILVVDRNSIDALNRIDEAITVATLPAYKPVVEGEMIATAISGGDTAPMSRPIGAWMRARSASLMPWAFSRSSRRAWVFFEPSAPI